MQYWLMKTEPSTYSIDDLKQQGKTAWEGVRNYTARNYMRDHMQIGDAVIIYHSNATPSAAVGIGEVCSKAYPDASQFDESGPYYDPKATKEHPRWQLVDVCYKKTFSRPVGISQMRNISGLANMEILRQGSRLSITPLTREEYEILVTLGN